MTNLSVNCKVYRKMAKITDLGLVNLHHILIPVL